MSEKDKRYWRTVADDIDELLTGFPMQYVLESMGVMFLARPMTKRELCEVVATMDISPAAASVFGFYAK